MLNYFNNSNTNASAESFNAKIKAFRAQFRGVRDVTFFSYIASLKFMLNLCSSPIIMLDPEIAAHLSYFKRIKHITS
ncbi:transposase [Tenacibaculum finnmarkense]|uniref:transposase n=1 Tax=Tenacibaculum finnmarkense TaxID=2781243 RepID=UPI001EFAAFE5